MIVNKVKNLINIIWTGDNKEKIFVSFSCLSGGHIQELKISRDEEKLENAPNLIFTDLSLVSSPQQVSDTISLQTQKGWIYSVCSSADIFEYSQNKEKTKVTVHIRSIFSTPSGDSPYRAYSERWYTIIKGINAIFVRAQFINEEEKEIITPEIHMARWNFPEDVVDTYAFHHIAQYNAGRPSDEVAPPNREKFYTGKLHQGKPISPNEILGPIVEKENKSSLTPKEYMRWKGIEWLAMYNSSGEGGVGVIHLDINQPSLPEIIDFTPVKAIGWTEPKWIASILPPNFISYLGSYYIYYPFLGDYSEVHEFACKKIFYLKPLKINEFYLVGTHIHTIYDHGGTIPEVIELTDKLGFDAVAVVVKDNFSTKRKFQRFLQEIRKEAEEHPNLLILPGQELYRYPEEVLHIDYWGLPLEKVYFRNARLHPVSYWIDEISSGGGYVAIHHPTSQNIPWAYFPGGEVFNGNLTAIGNIFPSQWATHDPYWRQTIMLMEKCDQWWLDGYRIFWHFESDAHFLQEIYWQYSYIKAKELAPESLVGAVKQGKEIGSRGPIIVVPKIEKAGVGDEFYTSEDKVKLKLWCKSVLPLERIQVFVNGKVAYETNWYAQFTNEEFLEIPISVHSDDLYVIRAILYDIAGHRSFTNPIFGHRQKSMSRKISSGKRPSLSVKVGMR